MQEIFTTIFYQPILNLLVFIYNFLPGHDIGLSIIFLTIIIKLILWPLSQQSVKSQRSLMNLQPKIDEIKKQYASNKEQMGKAIIELYKQERVNPFSSCLPLLAQLPFFWAVFQVFRDGLGGESLDLVYSFISRPELINPISFGLIDLSKPNVLLAAVVGLTQYWQAKMLPIKRPEMNNSGSRDEDMAAMINKQMIYFMPVFTVVICLTLPSGLSLYWLVLNLLTILQQFYLFRGEKPAV